MASKDRIKLFFGAGLALAVGAVFADTVVSQTFEGATLGEIGESLTGWSVKGGAGGAVKTVDGTIKTGNDVARPITDTGTKVLAIAGEVTCTSTTASGNYVVSDFLVNITEGSDEALAVPSPDDGVQIAVAAGKATTVQETTTGQETTKIPLCVYCVPKPTSDNPSTDPTWVDTGIAIDTTTWHRLTLVFDYGNNNKTCQVNWDGVPVVTGKGYLKSDKSETQIAGSWYKLAKDNSASIATLKFVGAASIDDVLVTKGAAKTDVTPAYGESAVAAVALDTTTNVSIPLNKLSKWGVDGANITTAKIDNSGLTVAEKLAAGLEPGEDTKFQLTGMTLAANGKPTITFPGSVDVKNGVKPVYKVVVNGGTPKEIEPTASGGVLSASITLDDNEPVNKIQITATATAPTSTSTQATAE